MPKLEQRFDSKKEITEYYLVILQTTGYPSNESATIIPDADLSGSRISELRSGRRGWWSSAAEQTRFDREERLQPSENFKTAQL